MQDKLVTIPLSEDHEIRLRTKMFNTLDSDDDDEEPNEINMDRLLMIDMAHLEAELVTFPVVLNMLGMVLAEVTNKHNAAKLDLEIYQAKARERIRTEHLEANVEDDEDGEEDTGKRSKKRPVRRKPLTLDEVDSRLSIDPAYIAKKRIMYKRQMEMEQINSLYWSAKSKDDKLNKLSLTIKAGDVYDSLAASKLKRINMVDISGIKPTRKDG